MKLRFVSDGTYAGTDVLTPDGKCFAGVLNFELRMDWDRGGHPEPLATVTLAKVDRIDIVADAELECMHDGRRYAMHDIGPATEGD